MGGYRCGIGRIRTCTAAFRERHPQLTLPDHYQPIFFVCVYHSATTPFAGLFPAVVLLRASRRTVRNHHTDCLCALEARKPLPSPEAAKHPSLKNSNHEHHRLRTLSFQSCPVDLLGFQERFDFEPAEQYRRVLAAPAFIPRIFLRLI